MNYRPVMNFGLSCIASSLVISALGCFIAFSMYEDNLDVITGSFLLIAITIGYSVFNYYMLDIMSVNVGKQTEQIKKVYSEKVDEITLTLMDLKEHLAKTQTKYNTLKKKLKKQAQSQNHEEVPQV